MFKSWCKNNGFYEKKSNPSHVLMDKGVLYVPYDRLNEFYAKYIEYIKKEKLYVVEQKTLDSYNFFVDLDYKDDEALTVEHVERICRVICDKVYKYGGRDALISVAKPKPHGDYIKTGVHINWPNFPVNRSSALALRDHIISTLQLVYGSKDWNDIVDLSVYGSSERNTKGSGFRMPYSHKMVNCKECQGKGCDSCEKGRLIQGEYLPIFLYKSGVLGFMQKISSNPTVDIMWMATLRTKDGTEPRVIVGSKSKTEGAFTSAQTNDELTDRTVILTLQEFIQKNMEGQSRAIITHIYKHQNQHLVATTSRYCENTKRAHGSNHVWFHIIGNVIRQKCFCKCETMRDRHYGFCKDFSGRQFALTPKIVEKMELTKYKEISKKQQGTQRSDDVLKDLTTYVNKYIARTELNLTELKKEKKKGAYSIKTDHQCDACEKEVAFTITGKTIEQVCGCANRKHKLTDKICNKL